MWPSTSSEVFLIFATQLYQYFSVSLVFALVSDKPEVCLPKYSQTAIFHAAHFQRVVNRCSRCVCCGGGGGGLMGLVFVGCNYHVPHPLLTLTLSPPNDSLSRDYHIPRHPKYYNTLHTHTWSLNVGGIRKQTIIVVGE